MLSDITFAILAIISGGFSMKIVKKNVYIVNIPIFLFALFILYSSTLFEYNLIPKKQIITSTDPSMNRRIILSTL